jgi:hypothetical protein
MDQAGREQEGETEMAEVPLNRRQEDALLAAYHAPAGAVRYSTSTKATVHASTAKALEWRGLGHASYGRFSLTDDGRTRAQHIELDRLREWATDTVIGSYWESHLADQVAGIPDREAVNKMRARYIESVRVKPEAMRQIVDWWKEQQR